MSDKIVITASKRNDLGKGASRRLRRIEGLMPAIIYGGQGEPMSISISHKDMLRATKNEALFSSILDLAVDGAVVPAIIKDLQRHPAKEFLLHADFMRVSMDKPIHVHVPIHFINEEACYGVRMQSGRIQHSLVELEVSCLPNNLPEYITVDMTAIEVGQILHISDLNLGDGVESLALSHGADHDLPVVAVVASKVESAGDDEGATDVKDEAEDGK